MIGRTNPLKERHREVNMQCRCCGRSISKDEEYTETYRGFNFVGFDCSDCWLKMVVKKDG